MKKENIHNPFKKLEWETQLPDNLEEKVMGSINFNKLLTNLAELFTLKIGETLTELFKTKPNKK